MDLFNSLLDLVVPPASMVMLAFAWPTLSFFHACQRLYNTIYSEDMYDKVVLITGASSGIGEQIAYEYAERGANLVLVARREDRLWAISENARQMGASHVLVMAADVVKEEDCRRFINETIHQYGQVDHLVNSASLGHTFYFEEATDTSILTRLMDVNFWGNIYPTFVALPYLRQSNGRVVVNASVSSWIPMPRMTLYAAEKAAVINFYETLRFEVGDEVGITIATHGWIGSEMTRGKFILEEGAEMQWNYGRKTEKCLSLEDFVRLIVSGACRGDAYVKFPGWYDIFFLYRVFAPDVLNWTLHLIFSTLSSMKKSLLGMGRPPLESTSPRKLLPGPLALSPLTPQQQQKLE